MSGGRDGVGGAAAGPGSVGRTMSALAPGPRPPAAASDAEPRTLLVKVFGKDRPGITTGPVHHPRRLRRRRRRLRAGGDPGPDSALRAGDRAAARRASCGPPCTSGPTEQQLQVEIISGTGDNRPRGEGRSHVTVLGAPLTAAAVAALSARITELRRQHRPDRAAGEVPGDGGRAGRLRRADRASCAPSWPPAAAVQRVDVAVVRAGPAAPGQAAGGDGRRLDADPGRGDRAASPRTPAARPRSPR